MSKEPPEWLRPALAQIIDDLPNPVVGELGQLMKGGFTKRPAIAAQWRQLIHGGLRIMPEVADLVRNGHGPCRVFSYWDPHCLQNWIAYLCDVTGPGPTAVALWLDPRPDVAAQAVPALLERPPVDPQIARRSWHRSIHQIFLSPFGIPEPSLETIPAPSIPAAPTPLSEGERADLERHRKWLKEARNQLAADKQSHDRQLRELRDQHAAAIANLQHDVENARRELATLHSEIGTRIRQEIDANLTAQIRPWLFQAIETETHADDSAPEFDRLQREIRGALDRQQQADRHAGNRARLRQELEELIEWRDQARITAGDALQPLSEWPVLIRRLDAAIVQRRRLLNDPLPDAPAWMPDLLSELAMANNLAAVESIVGRTTALAQAGLLSPDLLARFLDRVALRRAALSDELRRVQPPPPVRISDLLRGDAPGEILIDAFNWIGRAGDVLGVSTDPARFADSLRQLHPWLGNLARRSHPTLIRLFADGPDPGHRSLSANLQILWSGGEGRNRADAVLIGHLRHLRTANSVANVFVVSSDQEVLRQAVALGARHEDTIAFARRSVALLRTDSP